MPMMRTEFVTLPNKAAWNNATADFGSDSLELRLSNRTSCRDRRRDLVRLCKGCSHRRTDGP